MYIYLIVSFMLCDVSTKMVCLQYVELILNTLVSFVYANAIFNFLMLAENKEKRKRFFIIESYLEFRYFRWIYLNRSYVKYV